MPAASTARARPAMSLPPVLPLSAPIASALPSPEPQAFLTKEWILPPRPKPGRKPATDVPPTKRKAQNRAAQRAFRERRAQRVGELEEKLHVVEKNRDEIESDLRNEIESLKNKVEKWKLKYEMEVQKHESSADAPSMPTPSSTAPSEHMGCDNCTPSHCQCLTDILNYPSTEPLKRPLSPPGSSSISPVSGEERGAKRYRIDHSELETDFTAMFAKPVSAPSGGCGLCAPGSSCICASVEPDIAREAGLVPPTTSNQLSGCAGGKPGTCDRCQRDPQARLFCTSLASISKNEPGCSKASNCCGGTACRGGSSSTKAVPLTRSKQTMSCAETYSTLSEHPNFAEAMKTAKERETWLPRLHTAKKQASAPSKVTTSSAAPGALEIEVASVMGVLKHFERRFVDDK